MAQYLERLNFSLDFYLERRLMMKTREEIP
jgi:hypothetical protein